jgi:hypothetical protein
MMPASYSYLNKATCTAETPVENKVEYGSVKNVMLVFKHIAMALVSVTRRYLKDSYLLVSRYERIYE